MAEPSPSTPPDKTADNETTDRGTANARRGAIGVGLGVVALVGGLYVALNARGGNAAEAEAYLLSLRGTAIEGELVEDARPDRVWQARLVQHDGFTQLNEALLDLDRDGRFDQHWLYFTDGRLRRRRSSQDDGRFDVVEEYIEDEWFAGETDAAAPIDDELAALVGEAIAQAEEATAPNDEEAAARDDARIDAEIWLMSQQGRALEGPVLEDAMAEKPWRADLLQADDATRVSGAHLDLDRDGHIDQRWTYEGEDQITRTLSPGDDDQHSVRETWSDAGWQRD